MSVISYIVGDCDYPFDQPQPEPRNMNEHEREIPDHPSSIDIEVICDAAMIAVDSAWKNAPDGYRDVNGRDELKSVLPISWYEQERHWLKMCLGREATRQEFFIFWLLWRMWMQKAKHEDGFDIEELE